MSMNKDCFGDFGVGRISSSDACHGLFSRQLERLQNVTERDDCRQREGDAAVRERTGLREKIGAAERE